MRTITLHRWLMAEEPGGLRRETRWRLTEADALAIDPSSAVPGTAELRTLPDDWVRAGAAHLGTGRATADAGAPT